MSALFTRHLVLPARDKQSSRTSVHVSQDLTGTNEQPTLAGDKIKPISSLFDRCKQLYSDWGLGHFVPVVILSLYALAGAAVFYSFENPNETAYKLQIKSEVENRRTELILNLTRLSRDYPLKVEVTRQLILSYEAKLPGGADLDNISWTYLAAIFYAGTIFTTIGYGNIAPATTGGRVCTIVFALIGIPLVLAILNDMGQLLCKWANRSWRRSADLLRRIRLKQLKLPGHKYLNGHLSNGKSNGFHLNNNVETNKDLEAGRITEESTEESDKASMPVGLAILLSVGWLFFCASLFLLWESDWTFFNSFWFFFISLSTIGLGDVVPTNYTWMVINFYLVLVGLSLVSMTINIIQQRIEELMFHMMKMIQEEYEKLLTDGTLSEEEKEEVLRKVMDRQPFFMRKMLPMIMGERQKEQFDERCNEVVKSVLNSKEVQTDHLVGRPELSVQTSLSLATASIECQTELKPSCSQAVQVPSEEMIRSPSEISMVSSKLLELARGRGQRDSNVSTRTCDSDAELFEDASELPPSVPLSLSHLRRKAFMEMRSQPAALEEEQESVDCQTETLRDLGLLSDVSVATMPLLTSERSVQTQGALGWEKAVNTEMLQPGKTVSIQTDPSAGIPSWNLREVEVQTTDSYLKIARKLNALKLNRADSLHIMAVPVARTRTASEVGQKTHRSNGATPQAAANYST